MRWIEKIAKNNAELLTKRDTLALFNKIAEELGSISNACDFVKIERKTYYNWKLNVKTITTENKTKVLCSALRLNTIDTLDFLTEKSFKRTSRLFYTTLSTIYGKILDSEDLNEKKLLCDKFLKIMNKYSEPITQSLEIEINDMLANIRDVYPEYFEEIYKLEQNFRRESPIVIIGPEEIIGAKEEDTPFKIETEEEGGGRTWLSMTAT